MHTAAVHRLEDEMCVPPHETNETLQPEQTGFSSVTITPCIRNMRVEQNSLATLLPTYL